MKLTILTTGGTIDKIYFDRENAFQVGDPQILEVLKEANVTFQYKVKPILRKDSLELTDQDRQQIRRMVEQDENRRLVVTHGTDTMIRTAEALRNIPGKVIVLTGAMQPARFRQTDAVFNIGCAVMAVQLLTEGVYMVMNGRVFKPENARKNIELNRFEAISEEGADS